MKKKLAYIALLFITILLIINPQKSIEYAQKSLNLCGNIIIPSLFPFFICSGLLIYSGFCDIPARLMQPIMKPLFNVNGAGAVAFILGIISGYPLGALTVCQLYEQSYLSKSEAERLLSFCNNSGPLFILGAVGISLYHNPIIGIILYASHIIAAIITGLIFKYYKKNEYSAPVSTLNTNSLSDSEIFPTVISNSLQSILTICGTIVFFSVIANIALDAIPNIQYIKPYIIGLFEFTSGVTSLANNSVPIFEKLVLSAGIVGFAGLSVHIQVMGILNKSHLSLAPYIAGKSVQGILSMLLTYLILKLYPHEIPVFAPHCFEAGGAVAMNSLFIILTITTIIFITLSIVIFFSLKNHKKYYN